MCYVKLFTVDVLFVKMCLNSVETFRFVKREKKRLTKKLEVEEREATVRCKQVAAGGISLAAAAAALFTKVVAVFLLTEKKQ